jgi:hypothetical protein
VTLPAALPAAPVLSVTTRDTGGGLAARLSLAWDRPEELLASLEDGLESRIVFSARLSERRPGVLALFGDRVVAQARVVRRAYRDILSQRFVIDEDGRDRRSFATVEALLAALFTVDDLRFPVPVGPGASVAARVQVEPIRLMPPLSVVALAGAVVFATPWVRSSSP